MQRVPMQQLAHITVEIVDNLFDAEEITIDFQDLIIIKEAGQREMISGNQHSQRKSKTQPPFARKIRDEHKTYHNRWLPTGFETATRGNRMSKTIGTAAERMRSEIRKRRANAIINVRR